MATKKVKKIQNSKRLKKLAPEELESVWDKETAEAWAKLNPKQQKFLIQWLSNGYNASEAYRVVYNKDAENLVAAACGSRTLSSANIQTICGKMTNNNKTELISIKKVFTDALTAETPIFGDGAHIMDIEDHKTRILAANSLAKLNGELIDKSEKEVKVSQTLIINEAQRGDIDSFLQSTGQPPLKASKPIQTISKTPSPGPGFIKEELEVEDVVFGSFGEDEVTD